MTAVKHQAVDVAVIGGGPGGLHAAIAAAEFGARTALLDLFGMVGGQYAMQPGQPDTQSTDPQANEGRTLAARAEAAGVIVETGAEVFFAERPDNGFRIHAAQGADALVVEARAIVVATGAMERPVPFPGWTLPGVMGAGAAQRLVKASGTHPGKRVVLAGSGPFLLAVARTFADKNVPVAAFVEAARPTAGALALLARHPERIGEAMRLFDGLRRTRADRYRGWVVLEALGEDRIEAVRIAPIGRDGRPDQARSQVLTGIDALCVGYGFRPVIDVTALLGAGHSFDDTAGGWTCDADPATGATSVPGLYAAGETTGIAGAAPARLSGRLAGRHAAAFAGSGTDPAEPKTLVALHRARAFATGLARLFPHPRGLWADLPDDLIVCRCEDVTRGALKNAIAEGARDIASAKMWTRAGMGPCQGRICGSAVADLLTAELGTNPEDTGFNPPHLPLRPVALEIVEAAFAGED